MYFKHSKYFSFNVFYFGCLLTNFLSSAITISLWNIRDMNLCMIVQEMKNQFDSYN